MEMQIESTLEFHFTQMRMAPSKEPKDKKCWQGCVEAFIHSGASVTGVAIVGTSVEVSQKLKTETI